MFVNDGRKDSSWDIIKSLAKTDIHYCGICQSRNRGHQNAVLAGLTPGWASTTAIICFISGIQLLGIGVLGEYI